MVFPHTYRTENSITKTTSSMYGEFYEMNKIASESIEPQIMTLLNYVDDNEKEFIDDLAELVAIPNISCQFDKRKNVNAAIKITENWMKKLGVKYECFDVGWCELSEVCCKAPVVILGSLGRRPKKKTVLIYSHLDVTACAIDWDSDPWKLTEKNGSLYGKGVACGKGPLICWLQAIHAYQKHKLELPVNIQFMIESMNAQGSPGLERLILSKKKELSAVDYIVVCESEWLGSQTPCLVYGCTGICRFTATAKKVGDSDPKSDLEQLRNKLKDKNGKYLIPRFYAKVEDISPAEEKLYDTIDYDFDEIRPTLPIEKRHWDKTQLLMSYWRLPRIVLSDILKCTCEKQDEDIMKLDFAVSIVPNQQPATVSENIISNIFDACKQMKCRSHVDCSLVDASRPWIVNFISPSYEAARKASLQIYSIQPNMIREDRDYHIILMLERLLQKSILLLPLASTASNARKPNENISKRNFFGGIKLLIAYLYQVAAVNKK